MTTLFCNLCKKETNEKQSTCILVKVKRPIYKITNKSKSMQVGIIDWVDEDEPKIICNECKDKIIIASHSNDEMEILDG